jgi:hypothetical protein
MKCPECGSKHETVVPDDVKKLFKECGIETEWQMKHIYKDYCTKNPYFYGFFKTKCSICNEMKILGWEAGNSPPSREIIPPSCEVSFWPGYDYPRRKVRICDWCRPDIDDPQSQRDFLEILFEAMRKENEEVLAWKEKHRK